MTYKTITYELYDNIYIVTLPDLILYNDNI